MDEAPISITLIKPSPIDTPYTLNAKNYMEAEARHPAPACAPEVVARAILRAARKPKREVFVGGGGRDTALLGVLSPPLSDAFMRKVMAPQSKRAQQPPSQKGALDAPSNNLAGRGNYPGHTPEMSLHTFSALHRALTGASLLGAGLAVYALRQSRSGQSDAPPSHPPSVVNSFDHTPSDSDVPAPQTTVLDTVEVVETVEVIDVAEVTDMGNVTAVMDRAVMDRAVTDRAEMLGEGVAPPA